MKARDKQLRRLIRFIDEVKKGHFPNANTFSAKLRKDTLNPKDDLACSPKTIKRDIEYLKSYYNAPLEYDPSEKGYMLYVKDWNLPGVALSGDELFAELFTRRVSQNSLLPSMKEHLETGDEVQLTLSNNTQASQNTLSSLICATGKVIEINTDISENIIKAWKECFTTQTLYRKSSRHQIEKRTLDIHALFLSDNVWYCRAYCHDRQDFRTFCIHKFTQVELSENYFQRSADVINQLQQGKLFNTVSLSKVSALCSLEIADYINDREWFNHQESEYLKDGRLKISFENVPETAIKSWVSSFNGHVEILSPQNLRQSIFNAAQKLMQKHSSKPSL